MLLGWATFRATRIPPPSLAGHLHAPRLRSYAIGMTCERWRELKKPIGERKVSPPWMIAVEDFIIDNWKPVLAVLWMVFCLYGAVTSRPTPDDMLYDAEIYRRY